MKRMVRKIAFMLFFIIFTETVLAETDIDRAFDLNAEEVQNNDYEFDNEHIEEAIETTSEEIIVPDKAVSEGSILTDIIENISNAAEKKPEDSVLSEAAVDYEIDTADLPPEAEALLDEYYDTLGDSDRFLLNTYLMVREDTMEICCNEGLTVRESIPYALIMQIMEIDFEASEDMIAVYGSQQTAYDSASDSSLKMYNYACFTDNYVVNLFKKYVQSGYEFDSVMNAYAAALCMNRNIEDVISKETGNAENDVMQLAEKYSISISVAEEILSMYTAEEFDIAIGEVMDSLKRGNEGISAIANGDQEADADSVHDALNKGPMSYKEGTGASVDPSTGALSYVENICNIPGIAGLDLNINLLYSSSSPIQGRINNGNFDEAFNWRYSFPAIVNENGSYMNSGRSPQYLLLPSGGICEMIPETGSRYIPYVAHEKEFKLYYDTNHMGGAKSFYYVVYIDGKTDYFDEQGHWLMTTDRFGNKIEVKSRTESVMKIEDTMGNTITISNDGITKQTVIRPDGSQVEIYFDISNDTLTKIVQPGGLTTEFTYGAESKDNFHSSYITKIKKSSGLEHNFKYGYTVRPKLVKIKDDNGKVIDYGIESSKYQYGRIAEEYLTADNKTYNKKTYSYESDFMRASFGFNITCDCNWKHKHYYDGMVWRCMMGCSYDCTDPYVDSFSNVQIYDYSTTVAREGGTTIKYTYNSRNLNTSIEEYSGSQLINKTEMLYYKDCPLNIPYSVTYTEGDFVRIDSYTYTEHSDISEHKVMDRNYNILSMERYEYDYDHYGINKKITKKVDENTNVVTENILLNDGSSLSNKVIAKTLTTRGSVKESAAAYTYDTRGRNITTLDYIDTAEKKYIKTTYAYDDSACAALPSDIKTEGISGSQGYTYDKLGRVICVRARDDKKTLYRYDDMGNIIRVGYTDKKGIEKESEALSYDYIDNIITYTDGENRETIYDYDPIGNPVSVTKNKVQQESYTYDNLLRVSTHTEGKAVTSYEYDERDRIKAVITKDEDSTLRDVNYTYTKEKDYDFVSEYSFPVGISNYTKTDILGRVIEKVSYSNKSSYKYDMLGNVIQDTQGKLTTKYERNSAGNILSSEASDGVKTYAEYDMLGRMISSTDGNGNTTSYTYNNIGLLTSEKIPFEINSSGVMGYITNNNTYNNTGTLSRTSTNGIITTYEYDHRNRIIQEKRGNLITDYFYDKAGNMVQRNTGGGEQVHKYEYDDMNRLVKYTDAMGNSETYDYDRYNDMIRKTDRNGNVITYTYNGFHRMTSETADDVHNKWEYNNIDKIKRTVNDNVEITYEYNTVGLVSKERVYLKNDKYAIWRSYDSEGNNTKTEYYHRNAFFKKGTEYYYTARNQLKSVYKLTDEDGHSTKMVDYEYDNNGNLITADYKDVMRKELTYNAGNMVTEFSLYDSPISGSPAPIHIKYGYDHNGRMISKAEDNTCDITYKYDNKGQLIYESCVGNKRNSYEYTYDNMGNRTSRVYTTQKGNSDEITTENYSYDKNNRLIGKEIKITDKLNNLKYRTIYDYDKNGNQISEEKISVSDTKDFKLNTGGIFKKMTYNSLNQLVKYESNFINTQYAPSGDVTEEYAYMPNGYRISRNVNGKATDYLWDGDNVGLELDEDDKITRSYYRGLDLISDERYYYISDAEGNVINLYYDGTQDPTVYDAYGKTDEFYEVTDYNRKLYAPYGYRGQQLDKDTGFYYLRARYYDPDTGRFITEDPHWNINNMIYGDKEYKEGEIKYPDSLAIRQSANLYVYGMNNPVMYKDTNGHYSREDINKGYDYNTMLALLQFSINYNHAKANNDNNEMKKAQQGADNIRKSAENHANYESDMMKSYLDMAFKNADYFVQRNEIEENSFEYGVVVTKYMENALTQYAYYLAHDEQRTNTIIDFLIPGPIKSLYKFGLSIV